MEAVAEYPYSRLPISPDDLDLRHTLTPGQSFRWREDRQGRWTGVIGRKVFRLWREGEEIVWEAFSSHGSDTSDGDLIAGYLRLDVDLQALYADFCAADEHIRGAIERFRGLRVVRQDPEETLLSYICSSANSVPKISASIRELSRRYGDPIAELDGRMYHAFPTAQQLAGADLKSLYGGCGLGFRGKHLRSVAKHIAKRGPEWLASLRRATYDEARAELLAIRGVGRKIADCVLLFALDKDEACPVDTHIRKVACKHYMPAFRQKTLTPAVYQAVENCFRQKFGSYAGWAQEYLFYDDLLRRTPK
jgi:N-glycosylase/DNA lyase